MGAMVGCLVADAAATPVQWIYDTAVLEDLLQRRQQVCRLWCKAVVRVSDCGYGSGTAAVVKFSQAAVAMLCNSDSF